jgi:glycosyltransferase involved in cell wall biosynthesis
LRIALVVHHELVMGTGAAGSTLHLADTLRLRGHDVDVVGMELVAHRGRLDALRFPSAAAAWMRKAEREGRYDVIDASTGDAARLTRAEVAKWRTVLLTRSHGLEALGVAARREGAARGELTLRRRYSLYHAGWRLSEVARSIRVADAVAVLNGAEQDFVTSALSVEPARVFRTAPVAGAAYHEGEPDAVSQFAVLLVGGTQWRKGNRDALLALAAVASQHDVRVTWVGADEGDLGACPPELRAQVTLRPRVEASEMASVLANHSVLLHLSRFEGFGLSVLEAASHGLAIVATAIPGPRDILGDAGLLVPVGDVPATTEALSTLANPERRALAGAAAHLASRRYAPGRVVRLLENNYATAIATKARR